VKRKKSSAVPAYTCPDAFPQRALGEARLEIARLRRDAEQDKRAIEAARRILSYGSPR
jgi:hypothetical protein